VEYYQISEFAQLVGRHQNTVDSWFKQLEEKRLHYVNRVSGEKVYDELDLQIAMFIRKKREEKWSLEGIFNILEEQGFELRPFPLDHSSTPQAPDMDVLIREIRRAVNELAASQIEEVKRQYEEIISRLPKPEDELIRKQHRVTDIITERRVIAQLEEEALHAWYEKPKRERVKGFFGREDVEQRERFIQKYINDHFEARLKEAYGLEDDK
jgi:DNA-binding transcriptional MerR regulator